MFSDFSIGYAVVAFIFLIVIFIISLSKKKYNNIENSLFRFMLWTTVFLLVLEIICFFTIPNREKFSLLNELCCRSYMLVDIIWFIGVIGYARYLVDNKFYSKLSEFFEQKFMIGLIILSSVLFFISCFLPISYSYNNFKNIVTGPPVYLLYFAYVVVSIYMMYLLIRYKEKSNLVKRNLLLTFLIVYFIGLFFKFIYQTGYISVTYASSIYVLCIYFTLESQDAILLGELTEAKKVAEKADAEKTKFLSNMSHEIRTPMSTIMGLSEYLLNSDKLDKKEIQNDALDMHASAVSLLEIINNILDISKLESNSEFIEEMEYSITDIVYELLSFTDSKIDKKNVSFNINVNPDLPIKLYGDRFKIYTILSKIIDNSLKYTKSGEIYLDINQSVVDEITNIEFKISDTGVGIKDKDFGKLFEKFSKIDVNEFNKVEGAGLGLIIAKELVNLLGGEIDFKSEYAVGTTVVANIPQKVVDSSKIGSIELLHNRNKEYLDCSKKTILVVDDNELNLTLAEKKLNKYKFKILFAHSGKECIELLKNRKDIDMIFLDHMMPELDGIETVKIIKKIDQYFNIPVIVMTANVITENKKTYEDAGFDGYIAKPINPIKLNRIINKYFS